MVFAEQNILSTPAVDRMFCFNLFPFYHISMIFNMLRSVNISSYPMIKLK